MEFIEFFRVPIISNRVTLWALYLSYLEIFRALKLSNFVSFRALKLSKLMMESVWVDFT